jgi:DNA-binding winged helix-turn-helix (wHTH) protein/tetratricopeptide (TPR) repeat protein
MHVAHNPNPLIRFGLFEADLRSGELRKNGVKVKIQELPFRALRLLLSRPNEVLSRDEFRRFLWPEGVFVDFDHGISSAINRLRDALGDSADNPIFVETVERRGYRWIAPIHPVTPPARLEVIRTVPRAPEAPPDLPRVRESPRWRWLFVLPVIVLLVAGWVFRSSFRSLKPVPKSPAAAQQPLETRPAGSAEAEQFYLKGRFYWEKRTPDGLNKAVDYFTQAIVRDPNYAPAYVGLADSYNLLREYTKMPASEAYPRAMAAAKRAVELNDQSSEAHAALAFALFYGNWDAAGADREFRRAIELNPKSAPAHHWYATYLGALDRKSEGLAEIERAQALDPASKSILADKGSLLWTSGRRDEGTALLQQLEASDPEFVSPHRYLKSISFARQDYAGYLAEWKKEAILMKDGPTLKLVAAAQKGLAAAGRTGMLKNMLALEKKYYPQGSISAYTVAESAALLGDKKDALEYLKLAYANHEENLIQIENDTAFESLYDDDQYKDLMAHLKLPAHH